MQNEGFLRKQAVPYSPIIEADIRTLLLHPACELPTKAQVGIQLEVFSALAQFLPKISASCQQYVLNLPCSIHQGLSMSIPEEKEWPSTGHSVLY